MRSWIATLAALAALAATMGALAGCSGDDTEVDTPSLAPSTEAVTPTPTPSETPSPTVSASVTPTTSPTPSPSASATPTPTRGAQQGLRSARADARMIAPQLLDYYTRREFPLDLRQLRETLDGAGVSLTAGNSIGGYGLGDDGMSFTLCVQHDGGGWASYDTASGAVEDSGVTGSCPAR